MSTAIVETADLSAGYGATAVLHDVAITIPAREVVAVVGPNGAGKTTLASAITGAVRVFRGDIRFEGTSIVAWPSARRVIHGVASVPEGRRLFPMLTVRENLDLAFFSKRRLSSGRRRELLDSVFELFPRLRAREGQRAGSLSGGEQQMLAIGRALLLEPKLLILDEPSTGLAPIFVETIFERVRQIVTTHQCACLLIEQRAVLALEASDSAYVLNRGQIEFAGTAADILADPRLRDSYLGGPGTDHGDLAPTTSGGTR